MSKTEFLSTVPPGFHGASESLNLIPLNILEEMCNSTVKFISRNGLAIDPQEIKENLKNSDVHLSIDKVQNVANILQFILREASRFKINDEDSFIKSIRSNTQISIEIAQMLASYFSQNRDELITAYSTFTLGKLVGMDWKVGVSVASDSDEDLASPVITVALRIRNSDGSISTRTIEMDVPRFNNFAKAFNDMSSVIDTL
eukprot:gb/GECH01007070.1/.p1 GENE.gb/GECH01007070.1/~~gb/GECH01007070.1/.p1  ORF type:complete len:201 (+),score=34.61 gb/GECH01007070.1/:1-603(+)